MKAYLQIQDRLIGRIIKILASSGVKNPSEDSYILLQHFQVLNKNDSVINMPILVDANTVFGVRPKVGAIIIIIAVKLSLSRISYSTSTHSMITLMESAKSYNLHLMWCRNVLRQRS